jgi:hypothetical protein
MSEMSSRNSPIFAVDPGPIQSAYLVWNGSSILACGIKKNCDMIMPSSNMIVAIEHIQCFGLAVGATVFETAYWIGDFRCSCRQKGTLFLPVYRSEVKMHFCNSMRAKDANIRQALIDRLGAPGTKKNPGATYGVKGDIWSALAIAVMTADKEPKQ